MRRGSFTGAAEELRISQPAVSKHIADMERELGVKLIERRSRALTAAGEFLASHVLRAEAILVQAAHGVVALREPGLGTLSIRASGTPGTYLLPDVVASFQQQHPGVRVDFELGTSSEVVKAVRSHQAEIGVTGGFVAAPEIEAEPLIEDEIIIVGARSFKGRKLTRDHLEIPHLDLTRSRVGNSCDRQLRIVGSWYITQSPSLVAILGSNQAGSTARPWHLRIQSACGYGRIGSRHPGCDFVCSLESTTNFFSGAHSRCGAHPGRASVPFDVAERWGHQYSWPNSPVE